MSTKIGGGILIVLVILGGFLYLQRTPAEVNGNTDLGLGAGIIEYIDENGNIATTTVQFVPNEEVLGPAPSLTRPLVVPAAYTGNNKKVLEERYASALAGVKANPKDATAWLELGLIRKIAEDYEGAKEAWTYSAKLNPRSSVVHSNLADLYMLYLKDYPKAETEWRAVLTLDAQNTLAYRGLFELYTLHYTAKASEAPGVLLAGLTASPKNVDLMIPLALYYKEKGDTTNARKYFEEAKKEAEARGNTQLATILEEELNNL